MDNTHIKRFLKISDVASLFDINKSVLYRELARTKRGESNALPAFRISNGPRASWRVDRDRLEEWINNKR